MILNHDQRIFESASKEPGRYAFHGVLFRTEGDVTTATATDGKQLVRIEVTLDADEELPEDGALLDGRDLKAGWGRGKQTRTLRLEGGTWTLRNGATSTEISVIDGDFPNVEAVIPAPSSTRRMSFDVRILARMAKAAGADSVTLEVPEFKSGQVKGPIRVTLRETESGEQMGVLMPITVD